MKLALIGFVALLLLPLPALAQPGAWSGQRVYADDYPPAGGGYGYGYGYGYGRGRGRACVPACPHDYNPCDPINFKLADGRCRPFDSRR